MLGALPFAPIGARVDGQDDARDYLAARGASLDDQSLHFTQGWAAASVLVEAIRLAANSGLEVNGPNIRAALESLDDFETGGLLPPISFGPSDHLGTRGVVIYEVSGGEWVEASEFLELR